MNAIYSAAAAAAVCRRVAESRVNFNDLAKLAPTRLSALHLSPQID